MNNENNLKNDLAEENNIGNKKLIIVLGAAVIIGAIVITIALGGVIYKNIDNKANLTQTLAYELTSQQFVAVPSDEQDESVDLGFGSDQTAGTVVTGNGGQVVGQGASTTLQSQSEANVEKTTKNQAVEYYEKLSPNGENILSDHFENKYIKKISQDYGVDSDLLVAIYSEPDTGNNFVLEFSGKTDSSGNFIKSPDTLNKVYLIDKSGGVKIATGKDTGNVGVSYAEGLVSISMIKTVVMEQYPDYFTGLKN